jgi:hypothetical protein
LSISSSQVVAAVGAILVAAVEPAVLEQARDFL